MLVRFWLALMLLTVLPQPLCAQPAMLPPNSVDAVLHWLRPLAEGAEVLDGWILRDIAILQTTVDLRLEDRDGHSAKIHVQETQIQCEPQLPLQVCELVRKTLLTPPRPPSPWLQQTDPHVQLELPTPQFPPGDRTPLARQILLLAWVLLALLLVPLLPRLRHRLLLTLPLLVGILPRYAWTPVGLQHELFHARESLAFLHGPSAFANGETVPALVTALGHDAQTLFAVTAFFAVLTPLLTTMFTLTLNRKLPIALLAGLLVALLPPHLHFSASEEFGITGIALALLSWTAWLKWLENPQFLLLAVMYLSAILAMQTRPELLLLPLFHLTLAQATQPLALLRERLRHKSLWLLAIPAIALLWHVPLDMAQRGGFPGIDPRALKALIPRLIWLDSSMSSPVMLLWLVLGFVALWRQNRRSALWFLLVPLGLSALLLALYTAAGAYAWRMQLLPAVLGCILAAQSLHLLAAPVQRKLSGLAILVTAVVPLWTHAEVFHPALTGVQYAFQREAAHKLPEDTELFALLTAQIDALPALGGLAPTQIRKLHDIAHRNSGDLPAGKANQVYVQSAACWTQWPEQPDRPQKMQPACQQMHDRYDLEPIAEQDLPRVQEPPLAWVPIPANRGYRIGFYRMWPKGGRR